MPTSDDTVIRGPFRWGVLGTGNIARQFCRDLQALPGHELRLVGSRSGNRAADFAREFGGTAADGYHGVLDDPGVDAIYVSLPNTLHAEWTINALGEGRHVLCEKPLATSTAEAEAMFAAAEKADRHLVEAFMYRCHPQTQ
ncbi:MAG: Gfo/Idh/MocA family oxidoreductase, partial [Planctomycetota bacterium]